MTSPIVFSSKTLCIVTGSSRGIGRAIAMAISKKVEENSVLIITGRNASDLGETQHQVQAAAPGVRVIAVTADLAEQSALPNTLMGLTKDVNPEDFQHTILINNAASLGDTSRFVRDWSLSDVEYMQKYCMLNLTSAFLLTSHFLATFRAREGLRRTIVNITSLAAVKPMNACAIYCMGKAARDIWFQTLASEEPDTRVLSYSPGPVDTAMYRQMSTDCADDSVREMMVSIETNNVLLKPDQTASRLVRILEEDSFQSGAHIDYFDIKD